MEVLVWIWPSLGLGYEGVARNKSATKRGPGRCHKEGHFKNGRRNNARGRRF